MISINYKTGFNRYNAEFISYNKHSKRIYSTKTLDRLWVEEFGAVGWGGSGIAQDHPHYNNFWVGPQSHSEMPGEAIAQSSQAFVQCVGCCKVNEQEPDNGPSQVLSTNAITNVIPTKTGISQWISLMFHHF